MSPSTLALVLNQGIHYLWCGYNSFDLNIAIPISCLAHLLGARGVSAGECAASVWIVSVSFSSMASISLQRRVLNCTTGVACIRCSSTGNSWDESTEGTRA